MEAPKHNFDICNGKGVRCVHCCGLGYDLDKTGYEALFKKRSQVFNVTVRVFPEDLREYTRIMNSRGDGRKNKSCIYLGMVDDNPGCMIHPSRHDGVDVRADRRLIGKGCLPTHGCYFHNYFQTPRERKLSQETMNEVDNWLDYSRALKNIAIFNKTNGYVISRLPIRLVSRKNVVSLDGKIQEQLRKSFPRKMDDFERGLDEFFPSPTEAYMASSELFAAWGFGQIHSLEDLKKEPHFEKRFQRTDFSERGYHSDGERVLYVYKPLGEILPIRYEDVLIKSPEKVQQAIGVIDETIRAFRRKE